MFPVTEGDILLAHYPEMCRPVKYTQGRYHDIWLRVFDAEDVALWGEFLSCWLPGALERFARLNPEDGMC